MRKSLPLLLASLLLACAPGKLGEADHASHPYEQCPNKPNCPNKPRPDPPAPEPPRPAPPLDLGLSGQDWLAIAVAVAMVAGAAWVASKGAR